MSQKKIRVIVFDDHPAIRDNIELLVDAEPDMICVGTFPDCRDLERKIEKSEPDVIVMDIQMPGMNGIEGVKLIRGKFPAMRILMQTVFEDEQRIFDSICAGANGYILKKSSAEEIIKAIRDVHAGGSAMTPTVAGKVLEKVKGSFGAVSNPDDISLSEREHEILMLLSKGKSYKMIADELKISFHTVDSHLRKVYEKLHVHSMTEALDQARKRRLIYFF
ncbi:MAG: response regulator transcription factor [Chitinophagales bacterium]|nr:response regulator transcription factor [Chitinophagales bacterium]